MTYKLSSAGWLAEVCGLKVVHVPLPDSFLRGHLESFTAHHGIETHVQGGTGRDITQTQIARGFPIACWNVDDLGTIRQYMSFHFVAWHGDSVSRYAWGVEHTGDGVHALTQKQLDASAALYAGLIELTRDAFGSEIPLVKIPRVSLSNYRDVRGIWDHTDVDNGELNENGHVDHLVGRSWPEQLKKIASLMQRHPPVAPKFHGKLLHLGVELPDVLVWKRRMAAKGLFPLRHANDGPHYGNVIEQATRDFQRRRGIHVDGIVGPQTWGEGWSPR